MINPKLFVKENVFFFLNIIIPLTDITVNPLSHFVKIELD